MADRKELGGFLAGIGSGVTKLVVGHPFDTIKIRMQVEGLASGRFKGPLDALLKTVRNEGFRGLYKGATAPLFGWTAIDSVMMGTYSFFRVWFQNRDASLGRKVDPLNQPLSQIAAAGLAGGIAASFVAAPIEQVLLKIPGTKLVIKTRFSTGKSPAPGPVRRCNDEI
jgi:solute carrier family 25 carnitine/acylcarnitine transporter 20/29